LSRIVPVIHGSWADSVSPDLSASIVAALERGTVIFLPNLRFIVGAEEQAIFSPAILSSSKNTSFDPSTGRIAGTALTGSERDRLGAVIGRFSDAAASLVHQLLPPYRSGVERARASFRPAEVAGRRTSWRKDDSRLHVDAFPASPVQGRRILRVFSNVNPEGRARSWRVGGDFEPIAARFAGALSVPRPWTGVLLHAIGVTKSRRAAYDALMLQLHDRMKEDAAFQERSEQEAADFPPGSTWLAFTDQVSHAATAGQYQFEQTFILPVGAMIEPIRSPLRILERLKGCRLVT
jgi:hypothetical protein